MEATGPTPGGRTMEAWMEDPVMGGVAGMKLEGCECECEDVYIAVDLGTYAHLLVS
jgi:hypothetical protein